MVIDAAFRSCLTYDLLHVILVTMMNIRKDSYPSATHHRGCSLVPWVCSVSAYRVDPSVCRAEERVSVVMATSNSTSIGVLAILLHIGIV